MLSPRAAAQRRLRRLAILRGIRGGLRVRCSPIRRLAARAGDHRTARVFQRAGRASSAHEACHGALTRHRAIAADGRAGLQHPADRTLLLVLLPYPPSPPPALQRARARPGHAVGALFSMYRQSACEKRGLGRLISRHQAALIWILVWLQGLTLKIDSLRFLYGAISRATRVDQAMAAAAPGAVVRAAGHAAGHPAAALNYALMTLLIGPYLGTIFLVNHIGTRVIEPRRADLVVRAGDFRHAEPGRLPAARLPVWRPEQSHRASPVSVDADRPAARRAPHHARVLPRHGIPYREMSWLQAARETTRHFKAMSAFVPD